MMLFRFIKYLNPISYYSRLTDKSKSFYISYYDLPKMYRSRIILDYGYSTKSAFLRDAAYQIFLQGIALDLREMNIEPSSIRLDERMKICDEYRFIKRHFKIHWYYYVLIVRILTLHNPFKEISFFLKNYNIKMIEQKRLKSVNDKVTLDNNNTLDRVSIVIATLNRYGYLKDLLKDIERQSYKNFEVIIIDQSDNFEQSFYDNFKFSKKVIYQDKKLLWKARNRGVNESSSSYIAFLDDDCKIGEDWLFWHMHYIRKYNVSISTGNLQNSLDTMNSSIGFSSQMPTGNCVIKYEVFKKIGLFDSQFEKMRMGDGEFGMRAIINGFIIISNPKSPIVDYKASSGGLRYFGSWDGYRTSKIFGPTPIPSVLYFYRLYFDLETVFLSILISLPFNLFSYKYKHSRIMKIISLFLFIFLFPFYIIKFFRSWFLSSRMIMEGQKIERI